METAQYGPLPAETETSPDNPSPLPPGAHRVAVVDLGSNSIRLLLAQVDAQGRVQVLNCVKSMVKLGEGAFEHDALQPAAMDRTIAVLKTFARTCRMYGVEQIAAVATASVREASNGRAFVERAKLETGVRFNVISGPEEARLVSIGVEAGLPLSDHPRVFMDIGGGSTEFAVSRNGEILAAESLHVGCVRLADRFFRKESGKVPRSLFEEVKDYVREKSFLPFERVRACRPAEMIASSGTAGALGAMAEAMRHGSADDQGGCYVLLDEARAISERLCGTTPAERLRLPGMSARRVDVIIPGAAIFLTAMEELGFDRVEITERGLRDGVLLQHLENSGLIPGRAREREQKINAVKGFARTFSADLFHAKKVSGFVLQLFDQARRESLVELDPAWRDILFYAAWLQETGIAISYHNLAEHSAYIVANSELLGFTEYETQQIAAVIFRSRYQGREEPGYIALSSNDWKEAALAGLLLKIAEGLDKSHRGAVTGFNLEARGRQVVMVVRADSESPIERENLTRIAKTMTSRLGRTFTVAWSAS